MDQLRQQGDALVNEIPDEGDGIKPRWIVTSGGAHSPADVPGEWMAPDGGPFDGWRARRAAQRAANTQERMIHNLGVYLEAIEAARLFLRKARTVPDELAERFHKVILGGSGTELERQSLGLLTGMEEDIQAARAKVVELQRLVREAHQRAQGI